MTATYGESSGIWDRPSDAIQILGGVIGWSRKKSRLVILNLFQDLSLWTERDGEPSMTSSLFFDFLRNHLIGYSKNRLQIGGINYLDKIFYKG
jgi:hypothetical protein